MEILGLFKKLDFLVVLGTLCAFNNSLREISLVGFRVELSTFKNKLKLTGTYNSMRKNENNQNNVCLHRSVPGKQEKNYFGSSTIPSLGQSVDRLEDALELVLETPEPVA